MAVVPVMPYALSLPYPCNLMRKDLSIQSLIIVSALGVSNVLKSVRLRKLTQNFLIIKRKCRAIRVPRDYEGFSVNTDILCYRVSSFSLSSYFAETRNS